jgi:prophage antirepressor-like protein
MSSETPLVAFNSAGTIMEQIMHECQRQDPGFSVEHPITVFGDAKNPLFCVKDLEIALGKKSIRHTVRSDAKREAASRMYNIDEDYKRVLVLYGKPRRMMCFTRRGLYKYIMTSRGVVSNMFRNFLLIVLEKLFENQVVTLEESVAEFRRQIEEERQQVSAAQERLGYTMAQYGNAKRAQHQAEMNMFRLQVQLQQERERVGHLAAALEDDVDEFAPNHRVELDAMRRIYMKTAFVCLEKSDTLQRRQAARMKKKKKEEKELGFDLSDPEFADIVGHMTLEFEDLDDDELFSIHNPPPELEHYYYSIRTTKPKTKLMVAEVFYQNKAHLDELKSYLAQTAATPEKDIYHTSLMDIRSKLSELFMRRNRPKKS